LISTIVTLISGHFDAITAQVGPPIEIDIYSFILELIKNGKGKKKLIKK